MLKITTFAIAIGAVTALFAFDAGALPVAATQQQASADDNLVLVRDGCGRGMRYSHRRQRCVVDGGGGPPPVVIVPGGVVRDGGCARGWRWSHRRGRCVRD
jgi:hypothetical protein